jgi:hypothetical protein
LRAGREPEQRTRVAHVDRAVEQILLDRFRELAKTQQVRHCAA